ncbi:M12 family metallopeptidase [Chitinophaga sp. Cy-1792]|uniref:M12 family metallopeptidase n=1 Tax=Chitinophaga sp. Cy-1792 TaxID=2608339 RepID=UPI00142331FD|nr:M12 family metallopeptidase [Chitinophaga sp. Cy-1792]NIG53964.1 hypothetical protein [Chitinophaga sp. Cy-1792]
MKLFFVPLTISILFLSACKKDVTVQQTSTPPTEKSGIGPRAAFFHQDREADEIIELKSAGKPLYIERFGDKYVLEGDIVLGKEQLEMLRQGSNDQNARNYIAGFAKRWSGINPTNKKSVIPYTVNGNVTAQGQWQITNAISEWEYYTNISFVPRTTQTDYVEFVLSTVNDSPIGRQGGKQIINFIQSDWYGSLAHEIGHALGMFHEQSRADRDNYIIIKWDNIKEAKKHNYQTYIARGYSGYDLGTFDFNSIMLYGSFTDDLNFVINPSLPQMTKLDGSTFDANRWGLSSGDIETIAYIYGPPFARIEKINIYDNEDPSGLGGYNARDEFIIKFYQDAAGTIPYTLNSSKRVNISVYRTQWVASMNRYWDYTDPLQVIIPAGVQSYSLGEYDSFENSYLGYVSDGVNYQMGVNEAYFTR